MKKTNNNKDNSGAFDAFVELCVEVGKEAGYNQKTEILRSFIRPFQAAKGDVYLLCKLLLCKNDARIYNLRDKQLVKLLSRLWQCSHQDMIADLANGDLSGNRFSSILSLQSSKL